MERWSVHYILLLTDRAEFDSVHADAPSDPNVHDFWAFGVFARKAQCLRKQHVGNQHTAAVQVCARSETHEQSPLWASPRIIAMNSWKSMKPSPLVSNSFIISAICWAPAAA